MPRSIRSTSRSSLISAYLNAAINPQHITLVGRGQASAESSRPCWQRLLGARVAWALVRAGWRARPAPAHMTNAFVRCAGGAAQGVGGGGDGRARASRRRSDRIEFVAALAVAGSGA